MDVYEHNWEQIDHKQDKSLSFITFAKWSKVAN